MTSLLCIRNLLIARLALGTTLALNTYPVGGYPNNLEERQRGDDQHGDSDSDSDSASGSDGPGGRSSTSGSGPTSVPGSANTASATTPVTFHGSRISHTSPGPTQSNTSGASSRNDGSDSGGISTGGIVGIVIALVFAAVMGAFIFLAWRRRVRHQRGLPQGRLLLTGTDSSAGGSRNPSSYNSQPEMSTRNHLLSTIPTDSTTTGSPSAMTNRTRSLVSTHHPQSLSEGSSFLLAPANLSNPHEQYRDGASSLGSNAVNTSTAATQASHQLYTYEESQRHSTLGSAQDHFGGPAAVLGVAESNAFAEARSASDNSEGERAGSSRRISELHQSMAAWQKQLEAEEEQMVSQGKASLGSSHPSGDALVAIVDPPPSYSNAES